MNISETYDVRSSFEEVKYLIELERYNMKKRKNDSDIVKWENQQIKLMKEDDLIGHQYVVIAVYGEFSEATRITVGNRTKEFDMAQF